MTSDEAYYNLLSWSREVSMIQSIVDLMEWDQRCFMPPKAYKYRAEQIALLTNVRHSKLRAPEVQKWLDRAAQGLNKADDGSVEKANLREWNRWHRRAVKIPERLAQEISRTTSEAGSIWEKAKQENDWKMFEPYLNRIVELKKMEADAIGYEEEPYDALLDTFEPGLTAKAFDHLLENLVTPLKKLLQDVLSSKISLEDHFLNRHFPIPVQEKFGLMVAKKIGYDFQKGRIDTTMHPFTTTLGPDDIRITTKYDEHNFCDAFFSTIHEVGHALYDQGLDYQYWGTPAGMAVSLGIHESQSRLWENHVARSHGFWRYWYPILTRHFPILSDIPLEKFWSGINKVSPSLIRIKADELTYSFHIIIRYEIEKQLMRGGLTVADLPEAWKEKMRLYLGCTPKNFSEGVLQDVHWSAGLIGYFPTYLLGNIYAAQLISKSEEEIGNLDDLAARGHYGILLAWLREKIHKKGSRFLPEHLIRHATGSPPQPHYFLNYLKNKFSRIYAI